MKNLSRYIDHTLLKADATENEVIKLCNEAKYEYKALIWFLFDTGIRSPTELMNIKVSDFYNNFK